MKTLTIPISARNLERQDPKETLELLRRVHADRVFLTIGNYRYDAASRADNFDVLRRMVKVVKEAGIAVGAWLHSFDFHDVGNAPFTKMAGADGKTSPARFCPMDDDFLDFVDDYIAELAASGIDTILFDDDYRYGHLGRLRAPCLCKHHVKDICRRLGEELDAETIGNYVLSASPNRYRDAWLASKGEGLDRFARRVRSAVDRINPTVRVGVCACMTTWDGDGSNTIRIAKYLAGNTRPLIRLIGAPYWAVRENDGNRLIDVIELSRMQAQWCRGEDIEVLAEGDTWPRPRYTTPSSYLELFHAALIADGGIEGIHKYMVPYDGHASVEQGYIEAHMENASFRASLEQIFADKNEAGICIFEHMEKIKDACLRRADGQEINWERALYSSASRFISQYSIPTRFGTDARCLAVFGENARHIPSPDTHDYLLDGYAAKILFDQGMDVGIEAWMGELADGLTADTQTPDLYHPTSDTYFRIFYPITLQKATIKPNCRVILWYVMGNKKLPAAYLYDNDAGQKFLVFLFDSRFVTRDASRNYMFQRALVEGIRAIDPDALPVICEGNPDLYLIAKQKENKLTLGLFNCCADRVMQRKIKLSAPIQSVRFIGCNGTFDGNTVEIDRLGAFDMAALEVEF
ncbi:MAG: hypothetical protein J6R04_06425 [Clostridia bacterium]|nr:hypothetical protein [Clostridia bacterium]